MSRLSEILRTAQTLLLQVGTPPIYVKIKRTLWSEVVELGYAPAGCGCEEEIGEEEVEKLMKRIKGFEEGITDACGEEMEVEDVEGADYGRK